MLRGLFVTITNVNFDNEAINKIIDEVKNITRSIEPDNPLDLQEYEKLMSDIWGSDEDTRSLKSLLLLGLRVWQHMHGMHMSSDIKTMKL